ncbi:lysine-sensitive aspartokinase 3 [Prosthecochloris marina]|uniref:Aspartokinase n=1 Tax=Prosthecochloris marina TaxID=2017681 RepID=A0A317T7N7_9CHLB|nr:MULTISPECIES: lysine-sensitive aspartokinase 3 [Prosthecochloris]PWW82538.1 lysine-sensitive aspartokinase 3 [Prosthecochloris marina]UZJ39367.1 lysine-sensitive aspartokinase 3 [Prosthecochloris sp. SCSIO W1102]
MAVMKFGGTSIGTAPAMKRAMEIVAAEKNRDVPLVVLSACSGITNKLIRIAEKAGESCLEEAMALSGEVREHHHDLVDFLINNDTRRKSLLEKVDAYVAELDVLIKGVDIVGELTARSFDTFCSFGELLSTTIFSEAMQEAGYEAVWLDIREVMITDDNFSAARPLESLCETNVKKAVKPLLEEGKVVITQGFIGSTKDGKTTTLGRGGSDFTAALLGAWLPSNEIQIWTDVDGVMTCDPRIIPDARSIRVMTFTEAAELSYLGAKVLHPDTIAPAVKQNIPVFVLNSLHPEAKGTVITNNPVTLEGMSYGGLVKSIAVKKGQCIINFRSNRMLGRHGFMAKIFEVFARTGVSVEMISTSEVSVSLTVNESVQLEELLAELRKMGDVEIEPNVATISVVGDNLRTSKGVAGRIFSAMKDVNIRMISQGASEINVGLVVEGDDVSKAVQSLHHEFFSGNETSGIFETPANKR